METKAIIEEFLEIYKMSPELWDEKDISYYNLGKRNAALDKLVEVLTKIDKNATRISVLTKITNLRSTFRREFKKVEESKQLGKEEYVPTLWYFDKMQFLVENGIERSRNFYLDPNPFEYTDNTYNISNVDPPLMHPNAPHTIARLILKRHYLRVRQIRQRRKVMRKIMFQKFVEYQRLSQKLLESFVFRLFKLHMPMDFDSLLEILPQNLTDISDNDCSGYTQTKTKIQNQKTTSDNQKDLKTQQFSDFQKCFEQNLTQETEDEFYKKYHVHLKFFHQLCKKFGSQLQSNTIDESATNSENDVKEKLIMSLEKLATGKHYSQIGENFNVHKSVVYKSFWKFIFVLRHEYGNDVSKLQKNECLEMNEKLLSKVDLPQVIGALTRIKFSVNYSKQQKLFTLLAIVDIEEKFHFVRIYNEDDNKDDSESDAYFSLLGEYCKKFYTQDDISNPNQMYLIITDQNVQQTEYFLKKDSFETDAEFLQMINTILKFEDSAVRKLIERWHILACDLELNLNSTPSIIQACVILHNLCQDFLIKENLPFQSFEDNNIDNNIQLDKKINDNNDKTKNTIYSIKNEDDYDYGNRTEDVQIFDFKEFINDNEYSKPDEEMIEIIENDKEADNFDESYKNVVDEDELILLTLQADDEKIIEPQQENNQAIGDECIFEEIIM